MAKQDLTTQQVIKRLASKFPSPQYGFITQVRSGTGAMYAGTADAVVDVAIRNVFYEDYY